MKKLLLLLLFISSTLYAQDWERHEFFEDELYEYYIDVEVWVLDDERVSFQVSFEDYTSEGWSDIRFRLSAILTYLEYRGTYYGLYIDSELDGEFIAYQWEDYTFLMDDVWLEFFYLSDGRSRRDQIDILVKTQELQEQHDLYFKQDITPYQFNMYKQDDLQKEFDLIRPDQQRR